MPIRKAPGVQQAVIAKRLQGNSKRQISRDLGIGRSTVDRILTESQVEAAVAQGRSELVEMVPEAMKVLRRALKEGVEAHELPKAALDAALNVIKGAGVYEERSRTRGEVHVFDEYANRDRGQLESELRERLERLGSQRPN